MICIVDYNVGNLQSVINAFRYLNLEVKIESKPEKLKDYDKIILPGVGAFGDAMESLKKTYMKSAVLEFAQSGKYVLGICLGMQLLFEYSYEFGKHEGLGVIKGSVKEFDKSRFKTALKVPHIGWNGLHVKQNSPLFRGLGDDFYLYFVHSFHVVCDEKYSIGETNYGYNFTSAVEHENIFGFQPHPEKSHENGLKILRNFVNL